MKISMVPKINLLLTAFIAVLFFASCTKEISFENGGTPPNAQGSVGGTALYELSGVGSTCTSVDVNGTYTAGTALTAANTITVQVSVDSIGSYTVTTATVNGISFKGTGTFTTTGTQTIILTGRGTPTTAGITDMSFGIDGCTFSLEVLGSTTGVAVFTLGGAPAACTGFTVAGTYTAGLVLTASNTVTFDVNVTAIGTYSIATAAVNGISFSKTGTFTTTGSQTVTLTGAGTPTAAGPFNYAVTTSTNTCSFSITTVAAGPVAVGTLNCGTATFAGVYTQGTALGAANTVTIPVTVTTAGSYSITTAAVNGVTFSGSGTLAAGAQTIVLTGSGTPVAAGDASFPISLGTSTCSFTVTFLPGTVSTTDFFRVTIDGVVTNFNVNLAVDPTPLLSSYTFAVSGDATTGSDVPHLDFTVNSISPIAPGTYTQPFNLTFATSRYYDPVSGQGYQPSEANSSPQLKVIVTSVSGNRLVGTFSGQYFDFNGTGTNSKQFTNGEFSVPY